MAVAVVFSRAVGAGSAPPVLVEVHLANGLPSFTLVGLPEAEVRESRERVRAALQNCQFEFPAQRITVNLAPADLPKESGRFDLPIALGLLAASGQLPAGSLTDAEFAGELSLTGELRAVRGALAMACALLDNGAPTRRLFLPLCCAPEAALAPGVEVYGAPHLLALCAHLRYSAAPDDTIMESCLPRAQAPEQRDAPPVPDFADVIGQAAVKRGLEIAAAGAHHALMVGPPGAGKSMLASRLPGILPAMSDQEALAAAAVASTVSNGQALANWRRRPFRAPHHSASAAALVGGGNPPRPGEITLAHHGVLFLDELPEFERRVLDMLREPLETGRIAISRAGHHCEFPAQCQVIAAMNPCPCGWHGDPSGRCRCPPGTVGRYRQRLSGPLLERIDLHLDVSPVPIDLLGRPRAPGDASSGPAAAVARSAPVEASRSIRRRVTHARQRQMARQGQPNAGLNIEALECHARLDQAGNRLLGDASRRFGWSARSHLRVRRIARTIADLHDSPEVEAAHVAEAIQFRRWQ